jgi:acyl carrier protein
MADNSVQTEQIDEILSSAMGVEPAEFDDDTVLGPEGLGVDSISMVEIVELIDMRMGVSISDEELDEFSGETVSDLKVFVENRAKSAA